jgi:hypothetical protein
MSALIRCHSVGVAESGCHCQAAHTHEQPLHAHVHVHVQQHVQHACKAAHVQRTTCTHDLAWRAAAQGRRRWRRRCGCGEAAPGVQRWVAGSRTKAEDRLLRVCCGRLGKSCHVCRAAAVRAVAQRQSKKVLAVASLPRSEGSSNHEQRAVCRDGPVWARESCSFTEIYVAGIKGGSPWPQRTEGRSLGAHISQ